MGRDRRPRHSLTLLVRPHPPVASGSDHFACSSPSHRFLPTRTTWAEARATRRVPPRAASVRGTNRHFHLVATVRWSLRTSTDLRHRGEKKLPWRLELTRFVFISLLSASRGWFRRCASWRYRLPRARAWHARALVAMGEKNKGQELLIREVRARTDAGGAAADASDGTACDADACGNAGVGRQLRRRDGHDQRSGGPVPVRGHGHRVPRRRGATCAFHQSERIPVPDPSVQRGHAQAHPTWTHVLRRRREPPFLRWKTHGHLAVQLQVRRAEQRSSARVGFDFEPAPALSARTRSGFRSRFNPSCVLHDKC